MVVLRYLHLQMMPDARWSPSEEAAALVKAKKAKLDAEKTHAVAIAAKVTDERQLM